MDNVTHIMLITYSFDSDYVAVPCKPEDLENVYNEYLDEDIASIINKYLNEEIATVINESEYEPIVRKHLDTLVELIYAEDEGYVDSDTDIATYRIIEIGNGYNPNAEFTYTKNK